MNIWLNIVLQDSSLIRACHCNFTHTPINTQDRHDLTTHRRLALQLLELSDPPPVIHPALPLLHFITTLAYSSASTCIAMVDSPLLEIVFIWYMLDFTGASHHSYAAVKHSELRRSVYENCQLHMRGLQASFVVQLIIKNPIAVPLFKLADSISEISGSYLRCRKDIWESLCYDDFYVCWRLKAIKCYIDEPGSILWTWRLIIIFFGDLLTIST